MRRQLIAHASGHGEAINFNCTGGGAGRGRHGYEYDWHASRRPLYASQSRDFRDITSPPKSFFESAKVSPSVRHARIIVAWKVWVFHTTSSLAVTGKGSSVGPEAAVLWLALVLSLQDTCRNRFACICKESCSAYKRKLSRPACCTE